MAVGNWEAIATAIRGMSRAELDAFQRQFGIVISPDWKSAKRFDDMTPEEQEEFYKLHRISPPNRSKTVKGKGHVSNGGGGIGGGAPA